MQQEQTLHHPIMCSQQHLWPHWPPSHPLLPPRHRQWQRWHKHVPIRPPHQHRPHHSHMRSTMPCPACEQRPQRQHGHRSTPKMWMVCRILDLPLPSMRSCHRHHHHHRCRRPIANPNLSASFGARRCDGSSSAASDVSCGVDVKICPVGVHVAVGDIVRWPSVCAAYAPAVPTARCSYVMHVSRCSVAFVGALVAIYATTTFTLPIIKEQQQQQQQEDEDEDDEEEE